MNQSDKHYIAFWGCLTAGAASDAGWAHIFYSVLALLSLAMHLITKK